MQNQGYSKLIGGFVAVLIVAGGIFGYATYKSKEIAINDDLDKVPTATTTTEQNTTQGVSTGIVAKNSDDEDDSEGDDGDVPVKQTPPPITTPVDNTKKTYKDGTYTAIGTYNSPGGMDKLKVTVTLKSNIITSATVVNMAGDKTSSRYQNMFIANYQSLVVGKNIDSVKLDVVSGSSLTPIGFNNALTTIKAQAKA